LYSTNNILQNNKYKFMDSEYKFYSFVWYVINVHESPIYPH